MVAMLLIRHRLQIKLIPFLYLLEEDCSGTGFACDEDGGEGFTSTSQQNLRLVLNMLLW